MSTATIQHQTPFGSATLRVVEHAGQQLAIARDEQNPHALLYAAKERAIARVVELISARPADRLLAEGDLLIPHDMVDLTAGRRSTFFVAKGYGFIQQRPVFCPELGAALLAAARQGGPRSFRRGVLASGEQETPIEQARRWGAHLLALSGAPAAYLAKELELCYAPICLVGASASQPSVEALLEALPPLLQADRRCPCASAMQPARQRGLVGDNWRTWL